MMEDMPLQGSMPIDPASAEEDLAQRITEDTGAGGDMALHAERKVELMGSEMFQDRKRLLATSR
jgi:hypothetical protein